MDNNSKQAGKGSKPRPVKKKQYNQNYDQIDWSNKKRVKMNVKTLIISDLHLNWRMADKIIKHESPDKIVFLGDYFDDFYDTPHDNLTMANWLKNSLDQPNRVHIMGNHDIHYAIANKSYKCSGYHSEKDFLINSVIKLDDWKKMPLFVWIDNWLCSHAGVHLNLFKLNKGKEDFKTWLENECYAALKIAFIGGPPEPILQAGYSRGGGSPVGGIIWCDQREFRSIPGVNQIFGHTPLEKPRWMNSGISNMDKYSQNLCLDVSHSQYYAIHNSDTNVVTTHFSGDI